MRVATRVVLSVGTIAAHILMSVHLASGPGANDGIVPTAPVVIAQRDFAAGDRIDASNVTVAQWPTVAVPAGAYRSVREVAGLVTGTPVFRGEAIIPRRLAGARRTTGYLAITPGKRAMSFQVDNVFGMPGLIPPSSRVDLLVVLNKGDRPQMARLFMENVRVLALGMAPARAGDLRAARPAVATVEVTPDEGERLALVMTQGRIQLVPHNSPDQCAPDVTCGSVAPMPAPRQKPDTAHATPLVRNAVILRY
jgi:pilus assembly protein CpaB